jgi:uncharacterized protein (TIGR01777 family)
MNCKGAKLINNMEIAVAGGSGFIGRHLVRYMKDKDHGITLIRREDLYDERLISIVAGKDVVVNLVGEPIAGRWTRSKKRKIQESRTHTTERLVKAVLASEPKAKVFIQGSAIGIYDNKHSHTEKSVHLADNFLAQVVRSWESTAKKVMSHETRLVILRMGVVLGKDGGMIRKLMVPLRFGFGVQPGTGRQDVSFIHIDDLVSVVEYLIRQSEINGVVNAVSPERITFRELNRMLSKMLKPLWNITIPDCVLNLIFGEGASVILEGQHVVPGVLQDYGFGFQYPEIRSALNEITSGH